MPNPFVDYRVRPFEPEDRAAAVATGTPVVDWWHGEPEGAALHLVVEVVETSAIVGHLQARDRGVPEPSRRTGQCHFLLSVAPDHRRQGVGGLLYERLEAFAVGRGVRLLYGGYTETPDAPATAFLRRRGFVVLERFLPSSLDLEAFDPAGWRPAVDRVTDQGFALTTYAALGDTPENRLELHALEEAARAAQPFRAVEPYLTTPYEVWKTEFVRRDPTAIFLAASARIGEFVGVVTSLEWGFTGVHPLWVGRGVATALKALAMGEAKARGLVRIETENHEDNAAMLAVNRKLGFAFTDPEVVCVKALP